jgi:hypothetical protein
VTVLDACTLPASLQGSDWKYTYGANEVTVSFGTSAMSGLSYTARGEVLNNPSHFDVCFKHGLDILSFPVVIHKSRVLQFGRGEVCIIDVGYIVNHCCFI